MDWRNHFKTFFFFPQAFLLHKLPNLGQRAGCLHLSHMHMMLHLYIILTSKGMCDVSLAVQARKDTACFWERRGYYQRVTHSTWKGE